MAQITGLSKTQASRLLKLARDRRAREAEGVFLLEGEKLVRECLADRAASLSQAVVSQTYLQKGDPAVLKRLVAHPGPVHLCPDSVFGRLSDVRTSPGVLAIVEKPRWDEGEILRRPDLLGVYGDRLQDPTNLGTLIRTAAAFGADGLWLSPDSADAFNPKVVRASAGTVLALPIFSGAGMKRLMEAGCVVVAADSSPDGRDLRSIETIPDKVMLVMGNESTGLSPEVRRHARLFVHIRTRPGVESLNVTAAAAVCLFHLSGLRKLSGLPKDTSRRRR